MPQPFRLGDALHAIENASRRIERVLRLAGQNIILELCRGTPAHVGLLTRWYRPARKSSSHLPAALMAFCRSVSSLDLATRLPVSGSVYRRYQYGRLLTLTTCTLISSCHGFLDSKLVSQTAGNATGSADG